MTFKQSIRNDLGTLSDFELNRLDQFGRVNHQTLGHQMNDPQFRPIVEDLAQEELANRERRRVAAAYEDESLMGSSVGLSPDDPFVNDRIDPLENGMSAFDTAQSEVNSFHAPSEPLQSPDNSPKGGSSGSDSALTEREQKALLLHFVSTTLIPLSVTDADDYTSSCSDCSVSPIADGPHHEDECQFHYAYLKLDTENAHNSDCRHCEARPAVSGFHHEGSCPRGIPAIATWSVTASNYDVACSSCKSKPDSEGSHHDSSCEYHAPLPLYHTDQAHSGYCKACGALPYVAGPQHKHDCERHIDGIPIPVALVSD